MLSRLVYHVSEVVLPESQLPQDFLWQILLKYGVKKKFLKIVQLFHYGIKVKVSIIGRESAPFPVEVGIKQGEVLDPMLLNLFISVVDLQYTDYAALVAHTADSMQRMLDSLSTTYQAFGVQINTRKTEIVAQLPNHNQSTPSFDINGAELQSAPFSKYLGSIVSSTTKIDNDVIDKINKA
ncbi:uncharacterized protein LOC143034760 [Oratosquilla oratoria]|uniref:uncharacterized protein LOC143034760 n=1 Tax=Oratosquilla oratoria TaxID=337810 RepID=UPI003F7725C1